MSLLSGGTGRRALIGLVAAALVALAALGGPGAARAQAVPLTLDQLKNATYPSTLTHDRTAPLVDGAYSEPAAPGSASLVTVQFVDASITPDFAAVVLASSGGGSGTFFTLHLVTLENGAPVAGGGILLGDRIKLGTLSIVDNQVVIRMTVPGPNDPLCCPSQDETRVYGFTANGFGLIATPVPTLYAPQTPVPAASGMAGLAASHRATLALQLALLALALSTAAGARLLAARAR
jgi:hypothetical protein